MAPAAFSTVARGLVAALARRGVDRIFCVAGESYLPVLDVLYDTPEIDVVTTRHEGSAAFMAVTDAKLTGRAGVCLVNRGPGAANASIGVHAAAQDAAPLLLLVGHVRRAQIGKDVFQELDCLQMFGRLAKGIWVLHDAGSAEEFVSRAVRAAESGTPGPAVLVLPEDVLGEPFAGDAGEEPRRREWAAPAETAVDDVELLLRTARRPLTLAGAGVTSPSGRAALRAFSETHVVPVCTANKRQSALDNRHPHYAGHLHNATPAGQLALLDRADLVLAVGTRLDDVTTRGGLFPAAPEPHQALVHVYPDEGRIGVVHRPALGLACDPVALLRALADRPGPPLRNEREAWARELHRYEAEKAVWRPVDAGDGIVFGEVVAALDRLTGGDVVVTVDSGVFTSWVYRYLRFGPRGTLLGVSSSAMGYGVPAAVAALLRGSDVPVVAFVGDGGFLMNGSELATAVARRLPLVVVLSNNGSYGTIRMAQEQEFPGRSIATDLVNPDFARMAEAYGALGLTASEPGDVEPALRHALAHDGPVLVEVKTSLSWISAYRRLDGGPASPLPVTS
ncbi:MAG: thiamine pyrophosphate-binding protein [Actinobacteria bacterium]|nr:MAG: thiamine pyrophosphate-binding protein [Actinomycetota bacterium]